MLETDETTNAVDLDQLFNTLDPPTRKGLQDVLQGFSTWYVGQSDNLKETFKYLGPVAGEPDARDEELARDQKTFTDFVVNGARAVSAIAERRDDLAALVANGSIFARAISAENESFDRALAAFPDVLEQGCDDVQQPARGARRPEPSSPTSPSRRSRAWRRSCGDLHALLRTMRPAFEDLHLPGQQARRRQRLHRHPASLPGAAEAVAQEHQELGRGAQGGPGRGRVPAALRARDLGLDHPLRAGARPTTTRTATGRECCRSSTLSRYDEAANQLNALSPAERRHAQSFRGSRFCPGAATQPAPDGSNPFTDDGKLEADDCDPNIRPEGP